MRILLCLLLTASYGVIAGQDIHDVLDRVAVSADAQVSLLTCEPGGEVYTMYGHSAVRIRSDIHRLDVVFNYGTYSFGEDNFLIKFIRGKLPYSLSASNVDSFLAAYRREGRSVVENVIQVDSLARYELIRFINNNYRPENRKYLYDFFYDNCSSRIWDVIEESVEDTITLSSTVAPYTYRDLITIYQQPFAWVDLGVQLIIGSPADHLAGVTGQMFLPDYLQQRLSEASIEGVPLLAADRVLVTTDHSYDHSWAWLSPTLVFGLLLLLEILLGILAPGSRWLETYDAVWWAMLSIAGLLLTFMWLGTDHEATHRNYNLLWASPLYGLFWIRHIALQRYLTIALLLTSTLAIFGVFDLLPQAMPVVMVSLVSISILKLVRRLKPKVVMQQGIGVSDLSISAGV